MPTLLLIAANPSSAQILLRHWPYLKRAGASAIAGASTVNRPGLWPEAVHLIDLGPERGREGNALILNFIRQIKAFLTLPNLAQFTDLLICEQDCIFIKALPKFEGGFWAHLAGGPYPNLKAQQFYHPPWWMSRDMAKDVVKFGEEMVQDGDVEKGYTDFFIGRMKDRYGLDIKNLPGIYSRNTIEDKSDIDQIRALIKEDRLLMIHGVKTKAKLDEIMA